MEQKGKKLKGVIVSSSMKDTVVVVVTRFVKHPKYKKYSKKIKRYLVHAPNNTRPIGEKVTIQETRPISKNKRFAIVT